MVVVEPVWTFRVLRAEDSIVSQEILVIFVELLQDVMHQRLLAADQLSLLFLCWSNVELFEFLHY